MNNIKQKLTTSDVVVLIGEAAYGPQWVVPLSADLGVHRLSLGRWASGKAQMPRGVLEDLVVLLEDRRTELLRAREFLTAWLDDNKNS